jgi:Spy/CpxP family protein refolding chaperone
MKRITILSTLVVVLLVTGFVIVRAEARSRHGWYGHRWHHGGPTGYIVHELKLNDAQKAQIRTLWQEERPTLSAHIHEFLDENKEMNAIASNGNPDQTEVQKIADREANTIAAVLVEKAHLQSKIYSTVLDPEQRAKAGELQEKWEARLGHAADHLGMQGTGK